MSAAGNEQLQSSKISLDAICNALVVELKEVVRCSLKQCFVNILIHVLWIEWRLIPL